MTGEASPAVSASPTASAPNSSSTDAAHEYDLAGRELQFGRYDLLIDALRRANAHAVNPLPLYRTEFDVTRQLDISAFVLRRFIAGLGLAREDYRGFAHVEELLRDDNKLRNGLRDLSARLPDGSPGDDSPGTLLKLDAIARGAGSHPIEEREPAATALLLARARSLMREGDLARAYQDLSQALRGTRHLHAVNALLATYFHRSGNMVAAASACHVALLNLGPASGLDRPFGLQLDYKGFRILQIGPRFCALPRWRDARVDIVDGRPVLVAHRLPQGFRRWLLRHAPRGLVEWARRKVLRYFLTSKLDRRVIEADDLMTIMRRIDSTAAS